MRNHSPDRSAAAAAGEADEAEGRLPGRLCSKGFRALTTILMLGRNSPSYCTHRAATAAIWCTYENKTWVGNMVRIISSRFVFIFCPSRSHTVTTFGTEFFNDSTLLQCFRSRIKCYVVKFHFQVYMEIRLIIFTLATAFGGYSSPSLGSTHCLTLSSLSLGVAFIYNQEFSCFVHPCQKL